jgi:hypothetical protein
MLEIMKRILFRLAPLVLAPPLLGGCTTTFSGPRSSASAKQIEACEARADEIYALRYPAATMQSDVDAGSVGTPYSGATGRSQAQVLAGRHSREQLVNECLNGQTGTAPTNVPRPPAQK